MCAKTSAMNDDFSVDYKCLSFLSSAKWIKDWWSSENKYYKINEKNMKQVRQLDVDMSIFHDLATWISRVENMPMCWKLYNHFHCHKYPFSILKAVMKLDLNVLLFIL